jgi:hypothetical protein
MSKPILLSATVAAALCAATTFANAGHRHTKAPGLNSYAMVHRVAPASPGWSAWDSAGQPTSPMCPLLEGYPDCH